MTARAVPASSRRPHPSAPRLPKIRAKLLPPRPVRRCLPLLAAWLCLSPWLPGAVAQGLHSSPEYIAGFVRYVRWPGADAVAAWTVCAVGQAPAEPAQPYAGRQAQGRPFVLRHLAEGDAATGCHVLDLTAADAEAATRWLQRVRRQPVLTVGTGDRFCSAGGHICLHPGAGDRGFDINLSSLRDAGLVVSARLLKLVTAETGTTPPGPAGGGDPRGTP